MVETIKQRSVKGYGWIPDIPDHRDKYYTLHIKAGELPEKVDLRESGSLNFPVYDQGNLGSCTANAIGAAIQSELLKQRTDAFMPSRLFIYYNERDMEGTIGEDSGAMIRDGIKSVNQLGVCHETIWPYNIDTFIDKPNEQAYTEAMLHQVLQYDRVDNNRINDLKGVLAGGNTFVFGFSVYESFESQEVAQTGDAPLPGPDENQLGGHAVLCVGYDDAKQRFLVRNSWGDAWGQQGYFTLPYEYLTNENLADDFWVVKLVEA